MDVFCINICEIFTNKMLYDRLLSVADDNTFARISELKGFDDKVRHLSGRHFLKKILKNQYSIEHCELVYGEFGKPSIKDNSDIHFSISHSGNFVAIVVADVESGIDIENFEKFNDSYMERYKKYILSEKELNTDRNPTKSELFIKWTQKESITKAIGTGLNLSFNQLTTLGDNSFFSEEQEKIIGKFSCEIEQYGKYEGVTCHIDDTYYLSVVSKKPLNIKDLNFNKILAYSNTI